MSDESRMDIRNWMSTRPIRAAPQKGVDQGFCPRVLVADGVDGGSWLAGVMVSFEVPHLIWIVAERLEWLKS